MVMGLQDYPGKLGFSPMSAFDTAISSAVAKSMLAAFTPLGGGDMFDDLMAQMLDLSWGGPPKDTGGGKSTDSTSKDKDKDSGKKEKDVPNDIDQRVEKSVDDKGKLESGGSDQDIKKIIEKDGDKKTETVNSPDTSTIKSKLSEEGVTGGVLLVPGHAVAVKPGDDGSQAVHQKQSGSCWAYAANTAKTSGSKGGKSKGNGEVTVYDSGDGQKSKLEQFAGKQQIEALIVSKEKKA